LLATFPYQRFNDNDALVPAADTVHHIVVITGPFSCLELESTSHSAYSSPWLAEHFPPYSADSELPLKLTLDSYSIYEAVVCVFIS